MTYQALTLPPSGVARGITLAALAADNATVYQRSDDPTDGAEVRESWPEGTAGLSTTPADPAADGLDAAHSGAFVSVRA